ncbi:MAG: aminotransferase class I/II-fold pyridoxal phosphate-dependent enzyme [Oscillospiraceae bacterium]|nr:aminotransferase class I/II-fold pyridoxal phosphate-dependent enzyme [Oscillospiraceae bacterium]
MDLFSKCTTPLVDESIAAGVYPYFHTLESRQAPVVTMAGKERIMLGSNNYLGLTTHPRVMETAQAALEKYGTGCSGSRFLNGTLDLHVELEEALARFLGMEEAVVFSTGYQSNLGIITALCGRGDYIICDRENHASIYDACSMSKAKMMRYRHNDMADLERVLRMIPKESGVLIVVDGIFSMCGDICPLPKIVELAKKYGARTMVDDAHGLGVVGRNGRGTADHFGLTDQVDIIMGTFSKSLASLGGFMATNKRVAKYVRHNSRPFIFSASVPPASCAAALEALRIMEEQPEIVENLMAVSDYARNGFAKRGIKIRESNSAIIPLYTYDFDATLAIGKRLFDEGVYVNPVLPPATPPGECLLRTSYMATHTTDILDRAMDIIQMVFAEFGLVQEG